MKTSDKSYLEELLSSYPAVTPADIRRLELAGRELARDPEFQREFEQAAAEEVRLRTIQSD